MKNVIETITQEMKTVLNRVDDEEAVAVSQEIMAAKRIFITGEGRSGLMGKAVAMRLMHGGFTVFVTGETITPSIQSGDLLIAITGSGTTSTIVEFANKSQKIGARLVLVTTNREADLAKSADQVLVVPAATKKRRKHEPETIQPLGNQFDQSVHLLLDAVIIHTLHEKNQHDVNEEMKRRHTNLE
ncbi:6-phospho-3-hexuloisomerase [Aquibacillus albus]|uniref:6-phospho-3-hexuloisomerase n=1 Tax=Aquibacillus albus TaxID=1168171 RepID=A0ABS2N647_9BACI|nr:6-phospho-3-hexuloisomerase [Aquibacillus albus]MBM7573583.1 6-phospho-3-hexuloisomerase [Aquibacillus albus]